MPIAPGGACAIYDPSPSHSVLGRSGLLWLFQTSWSLGLASKQATHHSPSKEVMVRRQVLTACPASLLATHSYCPPCLRRTSSTCRLASSRLSDCSRSGVSATTSPLRRQKTEGEGMPVTWQRRVTAPPSCDVTSCRGTVKVGGLFFPVTHS